MRIEWPIVPAFQEGYVVQHIQLKDFGRIVSIEGQTLIVEVINQAGELRDRGMTCAWRREVCVVNFGLTNKFKGYKNLPQKSFFPPVAERYAVLSGSHKMGLIVEEYPDTYSVRRVDKYGSILHPESACHYLWEKDSCFIVEKHELNSIIEADEYTPPKKVSKKNKVRDKAVKTASPPIVFKPRREIVYEKSDYHCVICGFRDQNNKIGGLSIDHIIPISKGGSNELDNLQCMCKTCNNMKSNMYDYDFKMWYRRRYGALWIDDI